LKHGNWVPLSKAYVRFLPKNRPYTKMEAGYSLQVNYDNKSIVTLSGLSGLFGWSRNKVRLFFDEVGIEIVYPEETQKKQNQKGQIKRQIKDRSDFEKGQIRFIDSSPLNEQKDRSVEKKGQIKDRSKDTYIEPIIITNLDPKELSEKKPPNPKREFTNEVKDLYSLFCNTYSETLGDFFKKPDKQQQTTWMNTLRLMIERDKHPVPQIENVIKFAAEQYNGFLNGQEFAFQVLAPTSLRKKYQKMLGAIVKRSNQKTNGTVVRMSDRPLGVVDHNERFFAQLEAEKTQRAVNEF
jgi:hypothetical protein